MKKRYLYLLLFFMLFLGTIKAPVYYKAANIHDTVTKDEKKHQKTILIDISENSLYVVSDGKVSKRYPIASGKSKTPSPLGDFQVVEKAKWGEGFGAAWLGLNVPWGKYGIHGTKHPESIGRSASHGCFRMFNRHVCELYDTIEIGTTVKVISGMYGLLGNGYRTLAPGDYGGDVMIVQKKLREMGFYKLSIDGVYGTSMERALNKFQEANKLPITNRITPEIYKKLGIILFE